jgi:hypothetical protein
MKGKPVNIKAVDCMMGGYLRLNLPVVKQNSKTVWVRAARPVSQYGKWVPTLVKRHLRKHVKASYTRTRKYTFISKKEFHYEVLGEET